MLKADPSNTIPDIIVEEASRLNNIITDFLAVAKPRTPNLIRCRVDDILEKNITFLDSQIREQHYVIERQHGDNLPEIMADSDMLYQAFLNILINAMQAMPGGGKILIETIANYDTLTIFFKDSGGGIPQTLLEKIWDPFFTTKETGTGLGLGIVKNIIESHSGSVQIANRPEGGAQVSVKLSV
jgi:signal transduction histidine kinase